MCISSTLPVLFASDVCALSNVNDVKEIGFDEKLASAIDLDTEFRGGKRRNGEHVLFFRARKTGAPKSRLLHMPKALPPCDGRSPGSDQPDGCLQAGARIIPWSTVSFDPEESPDVIGEKLQDTEKRLQGGAEEAEDWHFLTATAENILRLTDSVGFRFKKTARSLPILRE